MDHWFSVIASGCELAANTVKELDDVGFVVIPGPVAPPQLSRLAAVYDAAVSGADPADVGGGRTTTRVCATLRRKAEHEDRRVAIAARRAVRMLRGGRLKMSARDAARLLGLSHQRVHQIMQAAAEER